PTARRAPRGRRRPPPLPMAGAFFEPRLLFGVSQRVLWSRRLPALLEPLQVVPAALDLPGTSHPLGHPGGHRPAAPVRASVGGRAVGVGAAVGGGPAQRRPQLFPAPAADSKGGRAMRSSAARCPCPPVPRHCSVSRSAKVLEAVELVVSAMSLASLPRASSQR